MPRPKYIDKAVQAFSQNGEREKMTSEERELAAAHFERVALIAMGNKSKLAFHYNLERAKFLRGEVPRIAENAVAYDQETGFKYTAFEDQTT